ncbi:hypothetical protein NQ314_021131, partial [Rhamnusium bicolor]
FGPRAGDLIHLGAKFAPCMRVDNKIKKEIDKIQAKERETACCIRNDDSGCKTISQWKKWSVAESGPGGRISGSVCGLDPKGAFHEEASLCSQVSCLNDVCGMLPFYFPETPDQFYRLWTSLFLHAGVLQLMISVLIQYFLMRDLEKLTGSLRIGIIYIGSGVAGNLASAIFVPYRAD